MKKSKKPKPKHQTRRSRPVPGFVKPDHQIRRREKIVPRSERVNVENVTPPPSPDHSRAHPHRSG